MKILIVDDDKAVSFLLQAFLSEYGEVDVAADGQLALDLYFSALLQGTPYTLICLDLMMPNVDGFTVMSRIREKEKEDGIPQQQAVKIVVITARSDEDSRTQAKELGCDAYLVKTEAQDKLLDTVAALGIKIDNN